jgi:hypothetical protein
MRFYDVPVNQSVPTEANRGLTSYTRSVDVTVIGSLWETALIVEAGVTGGYVPL